MAIHYIIYKITNILNGMIYIGKHKTTNINDQYMGSGLYLKREQKRLGIENFKKEILFECSSEEEMNKKEAELVDRNFVDRIDTYNRILGGGVGGCSEFAKLGAKALFDKFKTDQSFRRDYIEKQRNNSLKVWTDPEFRKNQSEILRKYWSCHTPPEFGKRGTLCHNYGQIRIYNDETQQSIWIHKDEKIPEGWRRGFKPLPYNIKNVDVLKQIFDFYKRNGLQKTKERYPELSGCTSSYLNKLVRKFI